MMDFPPQQSRKFCSTQKKLRQLIFTDICICNKSNHKLDNQERNEQTTGGKTWIQRDIHRLMFYNNFERNTTNFRWDKKHLESAIRGFIDYWLLSFVLQHNAVQYKYTMHRAIKNAFCQYTNMCSYIILSGICFTFFYFTSLIFFAVYYYVSFLHFSARCCNPVTPCCETNKELSYLNTLSFWSRG